MCARETKRKIQKQHDATPGGYATVLNRQVNIEVRVALGHARNLDAIAERGNRTVRPARAAVLRNITKNKACVDSTINERHG